MHYEPKQKVPVRRPRPLNLSGGRGLSRFSLLGRGGSLFSESGALPANSTTVPTKEEKEVDDAFLGIFGSMSESKSQMKRTQIQAEWKQEDKESVTPAATSVYLPRRIRRKGIKKVMSTYYLILVINSLLRRAAPPFFFVSNDKGGCRF